MIRPEQNGDILIRGLLISGIVVVMTMIVGIHSVNGSPESNSFAEGLRWGETDCSTTDSYDPARHYNTDEIQEQFTIGYNQGYIEAGCTIPSDSSMEKK
ncbi:MAG: hypothetical protein AB7P56_05900 [Nitrososphaeraceae archaeon]